MLGPLSQQTLGNKYLLGELLGQGGFGSVYKAENLYLKRSQAIKILLEHHFATPAFRARFIREAQVLAGLSHPNILPIYDFELEERMAYLVMPYISGGTLQTILKQQGALKLDETEAYLRQICAALQYAHTRNIVHLDLKPLNLLHQDGTLLLSDFGLAHLMKEGAVEGGTSLNFGSPHYMSPEHLRGEPQQRSDIYALGIILYQMLTGQIPFHGTTPEAIMIKHLTEPPPSLRVVRPDLPAPLDGVLNKALAKKPEERYSTAGNLLDDFKQALTLRAYSAPIPDSRPSLPPTIPTRQQAAPPLRAEPYPPQPQPNMQQADVPARPAALPKRGAILTAAFLVQLALLGGFSSLFSLSLIRYYGVSTVAFSSLTLITTSSLGVAAAVGGFLYNRFGPRNMATTGGILYGLSIVLVLLWPTLVGIDLSGLLGGVGIGLLTIASLTAVLQWFPERRGLVAGLVLAGATLGSSIPGLSVPLLYGLGSALNATFVLGLFACLIAIVAAQFLRQIPEGDGPFSFQTRREYKAGEVLLSPVWYVLLVLLFCSVGIGLNMALVTRWLMGSYALGIYSIISVVASTTGRILGGWLSDLIGRPRMLMILFGLQVVAWLAFLVRGAMPYMLLIGLILLCIGGCASVVPATTADVFGAKNVGAIYGIMLLIAPLGSIPMAWLLSSSGVYAAIPVLAGILLVGLILAFVLSPLTRKGVQSS